MEYRMHVGLRAQYGSLGGVGGGGGGGGGAGCGLRSKQWASLADIDRKLSSELDAAASRCSSADIF